MTTPREFAQEFSKFPDALRRLVEEELQAGNAIAAITYGFPAAPCGASLKLARAVKDERRKSSGEVKFYARNNAEYAGEFTTESRHFFVLEPPGPPEPPPDMDAIRKAVQGKSDPLTQFARTREAGSAQEIVQKESHPRSAVPPSEESRAPARALTCIESATGAERVLHFSDPRPPHEIRFELERLLMTLFKPTMDHGCLTMRADARVAGAQYSVVLRFEAAFLRKNYYSMRVVTSWEQYAATHHDYYRKAAGSWFSLWTRNFARTNPPRQGKSSAERYRQLCEAALSTEQHLDTVPAIQQAILEAMKRGATFATSHKEGGTNLYWRNGAFARTDYGDYPDQQQFSSDDEFLKFLRQFYDWETSKNAHPEKITDFEAWKLIFRLLRME